MTGYVFAGTPAERAGYASAAGSEEMTGHTLSENPKEPEYETVIAHGGGAYMGLETTNSLEALNNAVKSGYKVIELDMEISSDRKIIMLHDWDRTAEYYYGTGFDHKISAGKFLKLSVYGKLEVLTFDKLAKIMETQKDFKIVTDTKGDNIELLTIISEEYPDLVDRIIPQIYDYDQWEKVKDLGFRDIIFTLYAMPDIDVTRIASFNKEHEIYAVTMPDYMAEKGYCSQLSQLGIPVYVHPVSGYEDALKFMKMGACGVYTGTLLPEEFQGIEKDYYLTVLNKSSEIKLTDEKVEDLWQPCLHGVKAGDTTVYSVDGNVLYLGQQIPASLKEGKHNLRIQIMNNGQVLGSLDYFLWMNNGQLRILHKKYEYRLDSVIKPKGFDDVMVSGSVPDNISEILRNSLIAKKEEYIFFVNGTPWNYLNGKDFLPVQEGSFGKLLLPLEATMKQLGASSVSMSKTKDISIAYQNDTYFIMANSSILRKGFQSARIGTPVLLYLNKAMAGGELYQQITGRNFIQLDDILIILPEGISKNNINQKQIIQSAGLLF